VVPGGGVGSAPLLQRAGHHAQLRLVVRPVVSARIYKKFADFAVPKKGVKTGNPNDWNMKYCG
jgi:hypothetical protein